MKDRQKIEAQICDRLYKLKKYIDSKVGKGALAEDLYGDAVLKVLKKVKIEKIKNDYSLDVFMILCAKTVISDYYKKERMHKQLLENEYVCHISTIEESVEKEYEIKRENKKFMERIREELDDMCRRILVLLLFQNMRHCEIADVLGISREMVSSRIMRMRNKLGDVDLRKFREFKKEA